MEMNHMELNQSMGDVRSRVKHVSISDNILSIVTLEMETLTVSYTSSMGYSLLDSNEGKNEKQYDSLHTLLMNKSQFYVKLFHQELEKKLLGDLSVSKEDKKNE
jgi:hypothetical protein